MDNPIQELTGNEPMYRIAWEAKKTGVKGYGTGNFPYAEAKYYADEMNASNEDIFVHHWPELVPDYEKTQELGQDT